MFLQLLWLLEFLNKSVDILWNKVDIVADLCLIDVSVKIVRILLKLLCLIGFLDDFAFCHGIHLVNIIFNMYSFDFIY